MVFTFTADSWERFRDVLDHGLRDRWVAAVDRHGRREEGFFAIDRDGSVVLTDENNDSHIIDRDDIVALIHDPVLIPPRGAR